MKRFTGKIVNNTCENLDGMFENAIRDNSGMIPEIIADIFTARRIENKNETVVVIEFLND